MYELKFKFTQDGSVGAFDSSADDICHSVTGALRESYEKFIVPSGLRNFCSSHDSVKILDICFGIGYNSKAALKTILLKSDLNNISIDALDNNSYPVMLSPFIYDDNNFDIANLIILLSLLIDYPYFKYFVSEYADKFSGELKEFLNPDMYRFYEKLSLTGVLSEVNELNLLDLHNIYYQNVSDSMKNYFNPLYNRNIAFDVYIGDARKTLPELYNTYDFIFLDAFSPNKQPVLWTYEFLSLIKSKMDFNSVLVTYSNSTPVRNTFLELGFCVGKNLIDGKSFGTVVSLNPDNIDVPLDDFDRGMCKTRAGIPYRDLTFKYSAGQILDERYEAIKSSSKISSSKFRKMYESKQ